MSASERHERFVARASHGVKIDQSNAKGPSLLPARVPPSRKNVLTEIVLIKTLARDGKLSEAKAEVAVKLVLGQLEIAARRTGIVKIQGLGTFRINDGKVGQTVKASKAGKGVSSALRSKAKANA